MNRLLDYQLRILNQDRGKMFVPMNFYQEEREGLLETEIVYDFSGMINLKEWLKIHSDNLLEVLDVIENIFLLLDKCKEVLIDYKDLKITADTLFVSTEQSNKIRLQFVFREEEWNKPEFGRLIKEASGMADGNVKEYLEMMANRIDCENPSITGIINMTGRIKREVYICGWIGKSRAI